MLARLQTNNAVIEKGYSLETLDAGLEFTFLSTGPKGSVKKYILFKPMESVPGVFTMGFGDIMPGGELSDKVVTNNQDLSLIVGALLLAIECFFKQHPEKSLFIIGNTPSRTRLYRIIISRNFQSIESRFSIYGLTEGNWDPFVNNRSYEAYLIQLKNV